MILLTEQLNIFIWMVSFHEAPH